MVKRSNLSVYVIESSIARSLKSHIDKMLNVLLNESNGVDYIFCAGIKRITYHWMCHNIER